MEIIYIIALVLIAILPIIIGMIFCYSMNKRLCHTFQNFENLGSLVKGLNDDFIRIEEGLNKIIKTLKRKEYERK
jgi:hypothetical protein